MGEGIRKSRGALFLVAVIVGSIVQVIVGGLVVEFVAGGHAQFHAAAAVVLAGIGLAIRLRWSASGAASSLPALGFGVLATAWLVESLGAYGYGPDNDTRVSSFVLLHELGLILSALGMIATVAGVTAGIVVAGRRRAGTARAMLFAGALGMSVVGLWIFVILTGAGSVSD